MSGNGAVGSGDNIKLKPETLPEDKTKTFCQKWKIIELSLFGSVLREDFRADSDLDVLVTFAPNAPWTIIDLVTMEQELASLAGREVDLVERRVIEKSQNPIRRAEILNSAQVLYAVLPCPQVKHGYSGAHLAKAFDGKDVSRPITIHPPDSSSR